MKRAFYKIGEQIDNYGFYGELEFEYIITSDFGELEVNIDDIYKRWRPAILFGAMYFIEHYTENIGLVINVKNIDYNDVDTTSTVIAYLTVNALLTATGWALSRDIVFDRDKKSFIFPK
jgi:hypothetical protein